MKTAFLTLLLLSFSASANGRLNGIIEVLAGLNFCHFHYKDTDKEKSKVFQDSFQRQYHDKYKPILMDNDVKRLLQYSFKYQLAKAEEQKNLCDVLYDNIQQKKL